MIQAALITSLVQIALVTDANIYIAVKGNMWLEYCNKFDIKVNWANK